MSCYSSMVHGDCVKVIQTSQLSEMFKVLQKLKEAWIFTALAIFSLDPRRPCIGISPKVPKVLAIDHLLAINTLAK